MHFIINVSVRIFGYNWHFKVIIKKRRPSTELLNISCWSSSSLSTSFSLNLSLFASSYGREWNNITAKENVNGVSGARGGRELFHRNMEVQFYFCNTNKFLHKLFNLCAWECVSSLFQIHFAVNVRACVCLIHLFCILWYKGNWIFCLKLLKLIKFSFKNLIFISLFSNALREREREKERWNCYKKRLDAHKETLRSFTASKMNLFYNSQ